MTAGTRSEEAAELWSSVAATVEARESLFSDSVNPSPLCQLHRLTCGTCLQSEGLVSGAAQDIDAWASGIEYLSKQLLVDGADCDNLSAAIAGIARAIRMTIQMDVEPEVVDPTFIAKYQEEIRIAARRSVDQTVTDDEGGPS
jgi:hypothetical protein